MSTWLVVPVRSLKDGKRRLTPALDAGERAALVERLLVRTLEQAAEFPGLGQTLVVTACEAARACAVACGVRVLDDSGSGGLNDALAQARSTVEALGASRMLVVSADLPLLEADDLRACAQAAAGTTGTTIALAPDRAREGTNGMCLPASCAFDFSFGPNSFVEHLDRVRRLNMHAAVVERAGLAFDVDLPAHLSELAVLQTVNL